MVGKSLIRSLSYLRGPEYYNEIFILAQPRDPLSFLCSYLSQSLFVETIDVMDGWKRLKSAFAFVLRWHNAP